MSSAHEPQGWRVLGFGKHPEHAAAIQEHLRNAGLRARNFALTDDAAGDQQLVQELQTATYDAVAIGGYINGQDPETPPTPATTAWFNRILNIIHRHAPSAQVVLVVRPADALPAINRVLGDQPESQDRT